MQAVEALTAVIICYCALLTAGCDRAAESPAQPPAAHIQAPPGDTPKDRLTQAKKCLEAYPLAEFGEDLTDSAAAIVGREVAQEARAKLRRQVTLKEFEEVRISMLTRNFTASELSKLAEIYATNEGKSLLKKMRSYNDDWNRYLTPIVVKILSNTDEQISRQ